VLKTDQKSVYAYKRIKGDSEVLVILNLSKSPVNVALKDGATAGTYNDLFSEAVIEIKQGSKMEMEPWGYMVLTK